MEEVRMGIVVFNGDPRCKVFNSSSLLRIEQFGKSLQDVVFEVWMSKSMIYCPRAKGGETEETEADRTIFLLGGEIRPVRIEEALKTPSIIERLKENSAAIYIVKSRNLQEVQTT